MTRLVAYYRVSTQRQGRSGLGLEAQHVAVCPFCVRQRGLADDDLGPSGNRP